MVERAAIFPDYGTAAYQAEHGPAARIVLCASTVESPDLAMLLAGATAAEREAWQQLALHYAGDQGDAQLRHAISRNYPQLGADNILVFSGAQEAMFCAFHALLAPGDKVLGLAPHFEPLQQLPAAIGAEVASVALSPRPQGWQLDCDEFTASIAGDTRLALVNFPHNPTGAMINTDQLTHIVEACRRDGVWLFSDEVFRGLEYESDEGLPPAASLYERGISLGSIAKPFGLGGVRVGWLASRDEKFLQRCRVIKRSLSICTGRCDEVLANMALAQTDRLLARSRELIAENLQTLGHDNLADLLDWYPPRAGCVAFAALKTGDSYDFAERLRKQHGVLVLPGTFFGGESYRPFFRLGLGRRDFAEGFKALREFVVRSS